MISPDCRGRRAAPLPPDERRRAIVDALIPVIAREGRLLTTREIAEAAGVAEGTVFSVFTDKEELWRAVAVRVVEHDPADDDLGEVIAGDVGGDRLVAVIEATQKRILGMFRLMSVLGQYRPGHRPRTIPVSDALLTYLETTGLPLRVPAPLAAQVLRSLVFGQSHPLFTDTPTEPAVIAELFLHGVLAPPHDSQESP